MRTYTTWALVLSACWAGHAHAFGDARLTSVAAELDVREPEEARVELLLGLDVRSNWLSSLPLRGLDPDLRLLDVEVADAAPPEVAAGEPGELWLRWPDRRSAPRRGSHNLRLAYRTQQLSAADGSRREWSLPRWPVNLAGVQVRVLGPNGLTPLPPARDNLGEQVEREPSSLTFTRVELPRSEPYRVGFAVPARNRRAEPAAVAATRARGAAARRAAAALGCRRDRPPVRVSGAAQAARAAAAGRRSLAAADRSQARRPGLRALRAVAVTLHARAGPRAVLCVGRRDVRLGAARPCR